MRKPTRKLGRQTKILINMEEKILKCGGFAPISEREMLLSGGFNWRIINGLLNLARDIAKFISTYGDDFKEGYRKGLKREPIFA